MELSDDPQEVIDFVTTGIEQSMKGSSCELDVGFSYPRLLLSSSKRKWTASTAQLGNVSSEKV